jgi:DNA-binding Lrp family transcriptional regulator
MSDSGTNAFLSVTLSSHAKDDLDKFKSTVKSINSVSEAYHVTGAVDYVLRVHANDNAALESVINRLTELPTLTRVETTIIYSQI